MPDIFEGLKLPNGQTMPNRLAKASMEENLADEGQIPGDALTNLYQRWADGGAGLILTGNVMVAPDAMTGAGGVYLGKETLDQGDNRARFERWAKAGKSGGGQFFMQISHPGRQVFKQLGTQTVSASATSVGSEAGSMTGMSSDMFKPARALSGDEVEAMIQRFVDTAVAAEQCGFDGIQVHAAHGYLLSQFLSPLTNLREDEWGGSLENRARLLLEVIRGIRAHVASGFGVAVKLNSSDFQKGGFDVDDAKTIIEWLGNEAVDFVELSGGNLESTAMMGASGDERLAHVGANSTAIREIYFLEFAKDIVADAKMPIMITGGITQRESAEAALATDGVDIIGIATAITQNPNLPHDWKANRNLQITLPAANWKHKGRKSLARTAITKTHIVRMGNGHPPRARQNWITALFGQLRMISKQTKRYKKWLESLE